MVDTGLEEEEEEGGKRKRRAPSTGTQHESRVLKLGVYVSAARSGGEHTTVEHAPLPRWGWGAGGSVGVVFNDRLSLLETHSVQMRVVQTQNSAFQMSLCRPLVVLVQNSSGCRFLAPKHTCIHTQIPSLTHTHTHLHEHTHSLAPPASVSRLIWCSRLCSRHSWNARVNTSCRT